MELRPVVCKVGPRPAGGVSPMGRGSSSGILAHIYASFGENRGKLRGLGRQAGATIVSFDDLLFLRAEPLGYEWSSCVRKIRQNLIIMLLYENAQFPLRKK